MRKVICNATLCKNCGAGHCVFEEIELDPMGGCMGYDDGTMDDGFEEDRCPVGGVDRSGKVDSINIQTAVETPLWMAVWAAEPTRAIDVRMSYSDLKVICDLIDARRRTKNADN